MRAGTTILATVAALGTSSTALAQCGRPNAGLALQEGGALPGFVIARTVSFLPGSFFPEIQVYTRPDGIVQIWKRYPQTGDGVLVWEAKADSANGLPAELKSLCGEEWYDQYFPAPAGKGASGERVVFSAAPSPAAASVASGQASQNFAIADLDGDGNPDELHLDSNGLTVNLRAADGSITSTKHVPVGFAPSPVNSQLVVADFNGDLKPDVAVSDYGDGAADKGALVVLLGDGHGGFSAPSAFPAGPGPLSLAAADFDGNGTMDVVVANLDSGQVSLLLGNGHGAFASPVAFPVGAPIPRSLIAVRLDADALPDLVTANRGSGSVSVLLNTGGGFAAPRVVPVPFGPEYLATGDLDHDGLADLAVACQTANGLVILHGNGDGTFAAPAAIATGNYPASVGVQPLADGNTLLVVPDAITGDVWFASVSPQGTPGAPAFVPVGGAPTAIAAGDLSRDGWDDVVLAGGASDVMVARSDAGEGFHPPVGYPLGEDQANPQAAAIGDLDGDGKPDVIVASAGDGTGPGWVSVLLGNGDGTLRTAVNTAVNQSAQGLALGDLDRDGRLDVAVAAYGSNSGGADQGGLVVLFGKGGGTFRTPVVLTASGLHPEAVAAADLDGDGRLDLAAVAVGTPGDPATLLIFKGQAGGVFAPASARTLQTVGGTASGVAVGDLNGDGKPDIVAVSNFGAKIDVLLGDGRGNFTAAASTPSTDQGAGGLLLADLDADGRLDLVVPHCCGESDATFLPGNGDGSFGAAEHLPSGASVTGVAAARFLGTRGRDLVFVNQFGTWLPLVTDVLDLVRPIEPVRHRVRRAG